jgi:hypothetical protein
MSTLFMAAALFQAILLHQSLEALGARFDRFALVFALKL